MRLTESEAIEYVSSTQSVRPFNVTVRSACAAVAECLGVVGSLANMHAACRFYDARHKQVTTKLVAEVVVELLKIKENDGVSGRYLEDLKSRLNRFADDCRKDACDVSTSDVQAWMDSQKADDNKPLSRQSKKNFRTVLHTLFQFAVARGYASDNPVVGVEKFKNVRNGDVQIFTPTEIARLLAAATPDFLPSLALGAFAGLRSAEVERLEWKDIDLAERVIELKASKSKTASSRTIPISDNLAAWLAPYAGRDGKVWRGTSDMFYRAQAATAAATAVDADESRGVKAQSVEWKGNALRHSYASYRLRLLGGDAGRVAGELGNSATVVHRHYKQLVKKASDAERWFAVKPEGEASNVLPLAAVAAVAVGGT